MLIPSIDIMGGKAVKLIQGSASSAKYEVDALALAKKYSVFPEVNVIDLDAAFGTGNNRQLIKKICRICNCSVGGGIRREMLAVEYLKSGAKKLIIGTSANIGFLSRLPKERIIVTLDSKDGKVVDKGWKNETGESPLSRARSLEKYCSGFLYTYVDNEGTMAGIDLTTVKRLRKATSSRIYYAGGISKAAEVQKLDKIGADAVVGMAAYERRFDLADAFSSALDFKKGSDLIPTIVQEESGQVLMLAYTTEGSLKKAMKEKRGIYYSRSRKKIWKKGDTSGNTQELIRVFPDCDRDSLLFIVRQKGNACHTGRYSCFCDREFGILELSAVICERKSAPIEGSYTGRLMEDEKLLKEKIAEEAGEVVNYKNRANLIWEVADLMYFINVMMAKKGISWQEIDDELMSRNR